MLNRSGQTIIEYLLILVITAGVSSLLVSELINTNPENPGHMIKLWAAIIQAIGQA